MTTLRTRNRAGSESSTDDEREIYHHWQRHFVDPPTTSGALVHRPHHHHQHLIPRSRSIDSETPVFTLVDEDHSKPSRRHYPHASRSERPRSRSRGRSIHVDVFNKLNDRQIVEDYPPYPYTYSDPRPSWVGPHSWRNESNINNEANALAICNLRGRSLSPHHHRHHYSPSPHRPHIPALQEEKDLVRAQIRLEEDIKKETKKRAVDEYVLKQNKEEEEKKHIIKDALRDEDQRREKEKQKEKEAKEKWAAEEAEKKRKEEEAKKKREKETEDEMRHRMAKAGYHNKDIEAAIAAKKVHYCHEHHLPHPCSICSWGPASLNPSPGRVIYFKVRRDHICTETLDYYSLPWRYDPADVNLIIILKDKDSYDIDELFQHSRHRYTYDYYKRVWKRKTFSRRRWTRGRSPRLMLVR